MSEVSAFKQLYSEMIKSGGEGNLPKQQIKCYVKESFPHFLVTDNYFYVACYFTKKAVDDFKSKYSNVNITDLKSRVIHITDWTLEMNKVNSADVFTSYGGLEVRLIVKSFQTRLNDKDNVILSRHPVNLFRDDEIKTLIQNYTHKCIKKSVSGAKENMLDISKFSNKGNVNQGVVSFASGNVFSGYSFKEGKTQTVDINSIFKQEKGPDALKRLQVGAHASSKVKVIGGAKKGAKGKGKSASKASGVGAVADKITKFTPGDRKSVGKRSNARIVSRAPTLQSPGGDKHAGTTDHQSMKEFQKMLNYIKSKGKPTLGKRGGKHSTGHKHGSGKKSLK